MIRYALYARKSQEDEGRQVQSIGDQIHDLNRLATFQRLSIHVTLTEEKSAKEPYQRPVFDQLMKSISTGTVNGILAWDVSRLVRNMAEGGYLQHLLTKGTIQEIRTNSEVFRSGDNILPFVLQAAMSTQYSLNLSNYVKRGMKSKASKGHLPQVAPEGYFNDLNDHTIKPDPERFPLIRKAWEAMITGHSSVEEVREKLNGEWGYRTRQRKKVGGGPLSRSAMYRLFQNVFYAGYFTHKSLDYQLKKGEHTPMVTLEEFQTVQKLLQREFKARPQKHVFAYTGMIQCARCGCLITAERQAGRHGRGEFIYYYCTNARKTCRRIYVPEHEIERQLDEYLRTVTLDPDLKELLVRIIDRWHGEESEKKHRILEQNHRNVEAAERRMTKLIDLHLDGVITTEQFALKQRELQLKIGRCREAAEHSGEKLDEVRAITLETLEFAATARDHFLIGDAEQKRRITRTLGVSYTLDGKTLKAELHPLLQPICQMVSEPQILGSESKKDGSCEPSVPLGWLEGTASEPLQTIWDRAFDSSTIPRWA